MSAADKRKTGNTGDNAGGPHDSGRGQWQSYAPYLVLAALTLFFFRSLFSPVSRYWLWEDVLYFTHPARMFAAYCFSLGKFPFWNPFVFGGQPFFADIQTAVLYPFNLLHSLSTKSQGGGYLLLEFIEVLHYFLAGAFTFRFLRLTGADRYGSMLGGIAFAFSGYLVTHVIHTNFIFVFIWLPLVLELLERSLNNGKFRHVLGCTAVLAVSTAGGYPQFTLYIYYTLTLYWLVFEIFAKVSGGWNLKASLRRVLTLGFITAVALGFNLISWLPAAELAQYTPRSEMTYQASVEHSLEPRMLLKMLVPRFFGTQTPDTNTYWAAGYGSFWETCLFVGVLPLVLALFALKGLARNRHRVFAAALAAFCLWLALGKYGLLYKLFFHAAPGFGEFRHPGRFAGLVSFGLAALAAHGWTLLAGEKPEIKDSFFNSRLFFTLTGIALAVLAAVVYAGNGIDDPASAELAVRAALVSAGWVLLAAVVLYLVWRFRSRKNLSGWLGLAVCLVAFSELYWFGAPSLGGSLDPEKFYQDSPAVQRFQSDGAKEIFRINARSLENPGVMALRRNQGSIHQLFLLEGYNPLQLERRLKEVEKARQFDLLNVKYEIYLDQKNQRYGMQERRGYLPRAFLAGNWRVLHDDATILATLNDPAFDFRSEVVLEADPGIEPAGEFSAAGARAEIVSYTPGEIIVRTTCGTNALLVLSEWSYPAWKAWVDGEPAAILRADYALRAVALRPGDHQVRFAYESDTFRKGLLLSLATLGVLLVSAVVSLKLRKL